MRMVWHIIKHSARDIWDEVLYIIIFNIIWLIGSVLIIPWPFVTFSLFFTAHDIGQGKGIKLKTFFAHGRRMWKQAYIWGGINLAAAFILWTNLAFYAGIQAQWATAVRMFFVMLTIFWTILQLVSLSIYPRLVEPGFKLALRNAAVVIGRYPLAGLALVATILLVGLVAFIFPVYIFLGAMAMIAVVTNRAVAEVIDREMKQPPPA